MIKEKGSSRRKRWHGGKWAVERERFHLSHAVPPSENAGFITTEDVLPGILKNLGLTSPDTVEILRTRWLDVAKGAYSKHTRPAGVKDGTLVIYVDSSTWMSEISRFGQKDILLRAKSILGDAVVKQIRLQIDPDRR